MFLPYKVTANVTPEQRIINYKMQEKLNIEISNYIDSIANLPKELIKFKKAKMHQDIRSKMELVYDASD
jgi:hypothetical protein